MFKIACFSSKFSDNIATHKQPRYKENFTHSMGCILVIL